MKRREGKEEKKHKYLRMLADAKMAERLFEVPEGECVFSEDDQVAAAEGDSDVDMPERPDD